MKSKIVYILMLFLCCDLKAQHKIIYEYINKELFNGQAVVFIDTYKPPIKLEGTIFTPTKEDIEMAEQIFYQRYNLDLINLIFYKYEKNVKKKYCKYNRQYLGYIDFLGEKNIIINLLNFRHRKKATEAFEGWKEFYFVGFGEYYEKNTIRFVVNLDKHRLRLK